MSQLSYSVRLFDTTSLAADGSNIPRRSCEDYIRSTDYDIIVRDKLAVGGVTHKDRRLKPEYKGIIGMDDQLWINNNATHYITKLYFKDQVDNFFYANAETFDPDLFSGERKDNIINLQGTLLSGVKLPISVVIQALWSKRNVAEKIIRIKGFDHTANPSFKGAGMDSDIKIFSEIVEDNSKLISEDQIRQFADSNPNLGECKLQTRIYSSTGEVEVIDEDLTINSKIYSFEPSSLPDLIDKYGLFSDQVALAKKHLSNETAKNVMADVLKDDKDKNKELQSSIEDDVNLDYWANKFDEYTKYGNTNELQTLFRGNRDNIRNIVRSVPKDDPNHDTLILTRLNQFFRVNPKTNQYSTISSVSDRVRTSQLPRYEQINRVIKSYKSYWESKGSKLSTADKNQQKLLFLQDINLLLKNIYNELVQGKTINSLYGINRYGDEVRSSALTLSSTYRKLLIAQNIMKFVPKSLYGEWTVDLKGFYKSLLDYTFNESTDDVLLNMVDLVN